MIELTEKPIDVARVLRGVENPAAGAVVGGTGVAAGCGCAQAARDVAANVPERTPVIFRN